MAATDIDTEPMKQSPPEEGTLHDTPVEDSMPGTDHDSRSNAFSRVLAIVAGLIILLLIYALSLPAVLMMGSVFPEGLQAGMAGPFSKAFELFYAPLIWTITNVEPVEDFYEFYFVLWGL